MTFEKYYAYSDFKKNWGSPDEMKQEVEWIMARLLPKEDMLKSIEDLSTDKGIKFEIKLSSKDTIHMYKVSGWRMQENDGWEYYYNKKKTIYRKLKNQLEKEILSDLELFLKYFKSKGWFWGGDFKSIYDAPHFQKTFGYGWKDLMRLKRDRQGFVILKLT